MIFGDDIGQTNISVYSMGVLGYRTPNIDRIAKEGMTFTDYYAENSCTAGRSTFITGQVTLRTGMSKVGVPGAPVGIQPRDITIAQALRPLGSATGQFGKNHLGDRDEYLPTNHGFDEFFGNLYHLNAEEEPESVYWPKDDPSGMNGNNYADGMIEHDGDVGKLLDAVDNLGIVNDTIVVYTTDNGPNQFSWPDAAQTPFRSEKDTNWEGAFRVPAMVRWPGHIKAGTISNEIFSGLDWFPTLLAAAGDTTITERLLKGANIGGKTFKVHLDGYNLQVWANPFTCLRLSKLFNFRMDAYERADSVSDQYYDWLARSGFLTFKAVTRVGPFLATFKDYPPSQRAASFSIDQMTEALMKSLEQPMATAGTTGKK